MIDVAKAKLKREIQGQIDTSNMDTIKYLLNVLGDSKRILIGLNKCDCVESERFFDRVNNKLAERQERFLQEKVIDLRERVERDTGLLLSPDDIVYYSAGFYDEETQTQEKPYNIGQLGFMILRKIPKHKRVVQSTEESGEVRNSHNRGFWDDVLDFVDVVTDYIPALKVAKQAGKKLWDAITGWF